MLRSLTGPQLLRWRAYDDLYGLGDLLEVIAVLGTMIATATGAKAVKPGDVVPYFQVEKLPQTVEEMKAVFGGFAAAQNRRASQP